MSKSVEGVLDEKYPAYKDRHKLALEREKHIKEKAQQARAVRCKYKCSEFSTRSSTSSTSPARCTPPPPHRVGLLAHLLPGSLLRTGGGADKVHRAPELVEFYQSLMKREAKKDTSSLISTSSNASDARSNMIGEIENRSSFPIGSDVETQGDFVQSLATEVRAASFTNIEDLVAFVNWLDEELSFLVDERAVLKHFDWPEGKADALREAAFEHQDLMKLEKQVSLFNDDPNLPCEAALKKMYKLLEKVEQSVYALLRTRDMAVSRYKEFGIPVDWLLDSGVVGKIKLSSVQLARKYMKRVASELDAMTEPEKEPNKEFLILQGVRFAFRVHQFAGGFDAESMKAFEELRSRAHAQTTEENKAEAS
ncbi:UNVERIFIED_CONTAM: protein CHUP1, chloroplastic [Sesamum radiatum]|uniref:Protein CHUP1, chloroplastic n=1 Tax=Sesamum radiatum TaxID=300843 RepID=A0AAW2VPQ7_SESRA